MAALPLAAHEVPSRVVVTAYVKPQGEALTVLVRAPLSAMRDVSFPRKGPGYLDIEAAGPQLADAARLWLADEMRFFADGRSLGSPRLEAVRVSLPSSRAFAAFDSALEHVHAPPLPADTELYWEQGLLDVLLRYRLDDAEADLAMELSLAHLGLRTVTVLHFLPPQGGERIFHYEGDPGRVALDPAWHQAAGQFVVLGFDHVLDGIDHVLFVICLVIPFRRIKPLVMLVTAFTAAHSITLAAAALGMAPEGGWFPPLVETLIAASIVYMALENLLAPELSRRWLVAFAFGLVHGFGFSFVLGDSLQFAGSHLAVSLAAFNVGIELGQLLVVAVTVPVLAAVFRLGVPRRFAIAVASVLVAHTGWHWMLERGSAFLAYPLQAPQISGAWLAGAMRWLMLALVAVAVAWLLGLAYRRWTGADRASGGL